MANAALYGIVPLTSSGENVAIAPNPGITASRPPPKLDMAGTPVIISHGLLMLFGPFAAIMATIDSEILLSNTCSWDAGFIPSDAIVAPISASCAVVTSIEFSLLTMSIATVALSYSS